MGKLRNGMFAGYDNAEQQIDYETAEFHGAV